MSEEPDLVGTMLGSYRITGELSRGGMGAVYRGEHAVLERAVAIKLLRPELSENGELVQRFVNEAKAASAIRHPGIIEVLDFGHAPDGRAYYVMEMLEGESLAQRIAARGPLPEREAARLARGIAYALAAAHDLRIVHRDLKPDNVFLIGDPDLGERPKVLDFGIAKLSDAAKFTQTGALMGTPLYMAPEQARAAGAIDHRADLYSLGCMFYELLVGQPPFVAVGAGEIVALQLFGTAERPSARGIVVSPAIEAIVMRLLEKEPDDRFQSAAEVARAIDEVLEAPVRPGNLTATQVDAPAPARSLGLVAGLAVGALVVVGIVAFVMTRGSEPTPAPPAPAVVGPAVVEPPVVEPPIVPPEPAQVQQPAAVPQPTPDPPTSPPTHTPRPREKTRAIRTQKAGAVPTKYTKDGSPIEIDLN